MISLKYGNSKLEPLGENEINQRDSVVIDEETSETELQTSIPCWRKNLGWIIFLVVLIFGIIGISLVAIYLSRNPAEITPTKDLEKSQS